MRIQRTKNYILSIRGTENFSLNRLTLIRKVTAQQDPTYTHWEFHFFGVTLFGASFFWSNPFKGD